MTWRQLLEAVERERERKAEITDDADVIICDQAHYSPRELQGIGVAAIPGDDGLIFLFTGEEAP